MAIKRLFRGKQRSGHSPSAVAPTGRAVDLRLLDKGPRPVLVIREIRLEAGIEPSEANRIVENAPSPLRSGVPADVAARIVARLRGLGAAVDATYSDNGQRADEVLARADALLAQSVAQPTPKGQPAVQPVPNAQPAAQPAPNAQPDQTPSADAADTK